jgi:hypothetical protein
VMIPSAPFIASTHREFVERSGAYVCRADRVPILCARWDHSCRGRIGRVEGAELDRELLRRFRQLVRGKRWRFGRGTKFVWRPRDAA